MPDDVQFRQWVALAAAGDDFSDELGLIAQHVRVFLEDRGGDPRLNEAGAGEFKDERRRVVLAGKRGELQNAGVKNDSQDTAWRDAGRVHGASVRRTPPLPVPSSPCYGKHFRYLDTDWEALASGTAIGTGFFGDALPPLTSHGVIFRSPWGEFH